MAPEATLIETLPDGTVKHRHPVTGHEVWNVPGRSFRPNRSSRKSPAPALLTPKSTPDDFCDFCESRRLETPPEKNRWWRDEAGVWRSESFTPASRIPTGPADFRRIANLFEIIPYAYWTKNRGFHPPSDRLAWRDAYLAEAEGLKHARLLLHNKLKRAGWDDFRFSRLDDATIRDFSDPFFLGSHDLIIASRHFKPDALMDDDWMSSGDLDPDSHRHYVAAAAEAAKDILAHNPLAAYVAVFQNWLSPAGASFEHLHKQILGSDRSGPYPEALDLAAQGDPDLFNHRFLTPALEHGWCVAQNRHAVAVAAFGVPYPALWIFSKSRKGRPWEMSEDELGGFADLLHACHASSGRGLPTNEEWVYSPPGKPSHIPFHVVLKWRVNIHAGFEGASGILISPLSPGEMKDRLLDPLRKLKEDGMLGDVYINPSSVLADLPRLENK